MAIRYRVFLSSIGFAMLGIAAPACAQSDPLAEIDRTIQQSQSVPSALKLARDQIGQDDLIGAVATLERLLVDHPESDDALLFHANLLCRLDDGPGARVEIDELLGRVGESSTAWAEVRAACGPIPRATGRGVR